MCSGRWTSDPSEPSDEPDPPPQAVEIEVTCTVQLDQASVEELGRQVDRVLRGACDLLGRSRARLGVVIIHDQPMKALHEQFMQIAETTDVLTFDLRDDPADPVEGEIYVCFDEAHRRAEELGHPVEHEIVLYALHGLLHLVGYDDHTDDDWRDMHAAEDRLLEQLGIGRVFDVDGGGTTR